MSVRREIHGGGGRGGGARATGRKAPPVFQGMHNEARTDTGCLWKTRRARLAKQILATKPFARAASLFTQMT